MQGCLACFGFYSLHTKFSKKKKNVCCSHIRLSMQRVSFSENLEIVNDYLGNNSINGYRRSGEVKKHLSDHDNPYSFQKSQDLVHNFDKCGSCIPRYPNYDRLRNVNNQNEFHSNCEYATTASRHSSKKVVFQSTSKPGSCFGALSADLVTPIFNDESPSFRQVRALQSFSTATTVANAEEDANYPVLSIHRADIASGEKALTEVSSPSSEYHCWTSPHRSQRRRACLSSRSASPPPFYISYRLLPVSSPNEIPHVVRFSPVLSLDDEILTNERVMPATSANEDFIAGSDSWESPKRIRKRHLQLKFRPPTPSPLHPGAYSLNFSEKENDLEESELKKNVEWNVKDLVTLIPVEDDKNAHFSSAEYLPVDFCGDIQYLLPFRRLRRKSQRRLLARSYKARWPSPHLSGDSSDTSESDNEDENTTSFDDSDCMPLVTFSVPTEASKTITADEYMKKYRIKKDSAIKWPHKSFIQKVHDELDGIDNESSVSLSCNPPSIINFAPPLVWMAQQPRTIQEIQWEADSQMRHEKIMQRILTPKRQLDDEIIELSTLDWHLHAPVMTKQTSNNRGDELHILARQWHQNNSTVASPRSSDLYANISPISKFSDDVDDGDGNDDNPPVHASIPTPKFDVQTSTEGLETDRNDEAAFASCIVSFSHSSPTIIHPTDHSFKSPLRTQERRRLLSNRVPTPYRLSNRSCLRFRSRFSHPTPSSRRKGHHVNFAPPEPMSPMSPSKSLSRRRHIMQRPPTPYRPLLSSEEDQLLFLDFLMDLGVGGVDDIGIHRDDEKTNSDQESNFEQSLPNLFTDLHHQNGNSNMNIHANTDNRSNANNNESIYYKLSTGSPSQAFQGRKRPNSASVSNFISKNEDNCNNRSVIAHRRLRPLSEALPVTSSRRLRSNLRNRLRLHQHMSRLSGDATHMPMNLPTPSSDDGTTLPTPSVAFNPPSVSSVPPRPQSFRDPSRARVRRLRIARRPLTPLPFSFATLQASGALYISDANLSLGDGLQDEFGLSAAPTAAPMSEEMEEDPLLKSPLSEETQKE